MISQLKNIEFRFIKLLPNKKVPYESGWQKSKNYTYDKICKYKENIGVVAGFGKLRIIDIDVKTKEGFSEKLYKKALHFIAKFEKRFGETLVIQTPSKGFHIYILSDYKKNHIFRGDIEGEFRSERQQVLIPGCSVDQKFYKVLTDYPIVFVEKANIEEFIKPFITKRKLEYDGFATSRDETVSGCEIRMVMKLLKQGLNKKSIWSIMEESSKWRKRNDSYRENTYKKALSFLDENVHNEDSLEILDLKVLLEKGIPEVEWRVNNIIPLSGITILGGTTGSMKTYVAQLIALSCASGQPFLNHFATKKCKVLYLDEENGEVSMLNRFGNLAGGNFNLDDAIFINFFGGVKFDKNGSKELLSQAINEYKPHLVIIDSLVRFMTGEEDKATDAKKIFDTIKSIIKEYPNTAFLLLHHTTKTNTHSLVGLRGSGDFPAFADVVVMISKKGDKLKVKMEKNRHLDISKKNFSIDIASGDNSVQLILSNDVISETTAIDLCADDIREWVKNEEKELLKTNEIEAQMKLDGHARNAIFSALEKLMNSNYLIKHKRGYYKLNKINKINKIESLSE